MESRIPKIFAHRGCKTLAPENSLSAFQKVLDYGIKGVEFDVQLCGSGELVVIHDFDTKRVSGGVDFNISKTSLENLQNLDIGQTFSSDFKGEKIPTLEQVFNLLGKNVFYDIEIKTERNFPANFLTDKVMEMVDKFGLREQALISSFNPFIVRRAVKMGFPMTAVIFSEDDDVPFLFRRGGGWFIAKSNFLKPGRHIILDDRLLKAVKKYNIPFMTWTVDNVDEAEILLKKGVLGICSNRPEYLLKNMNLKKG